VALFPNQDAGGPSVRYYVMGGATSRGRRRGRHEAGQWDDDHPRDVTLEKIATTVRFSDEFSDDAPFLLQYLSTELSSAVVVKENSEILGRSPARPRCGWRRARRRQRWTCSPTRSPVGSR